MCCSGDHWSPYFCNKKYIKIIVYREGKVLKMLHNINVDVFSKMIKESNTYVVDFRDKEEFLENKIEGSINLPIEEIDKILPILEIF